MKKHDYCVYLIVNKSNTVIYTGVTSDIEDRVYKHKQKAYDGFSAKYECNKLVHYEEFQWIQDAIAREKQIKSWSRQKKIDLIVANNPSWSDLSDGWYEE